MYLLICAVGSHDCLPTDKHFQVTGNPISFTVTSSRIQGGQFTIHHSVDPKCHSVLSPEMMLVGDHYHMHTCDSIDTTDRANNSLTITVYYYVGNTFSFPHYYSCL